MPTDYVAAEDRYQDADAWFRRCGRSGLKLPAISIGCWHNFGGAGTDAVGHKDEAGTHDNARQMLFAAFDHGITHFDLANNYGPPPGSAEERVGRILHDDFAAYRDELIISSKAGYNDVGRPLRRLGQPQVSRRVVRGVAEAVKAGLRRHLLSPPAGPEHAAGGDDGRARYISSAAARRCTAAVSNYSGALTAEAIRVCEREGFAKPILHQPNYNMFDRWVEGDLLGVCESVGVGTICFSPLAQGQLTNKYLKDIPADSRAKQAGSFLNPKTRSRRRSRRRSAR